MTARLLLTEPQADILSGALEDAIEDAHGVTCEFDRGSPEYEEGFDSMKALIAIMEQIDEDNPILDAEARPGHEFDWEAFWKEVEERDEDGDDDDEEDVDGKEPSDIGKVIDGVLRIVDSVAPPSRAEGTGGH